MHRRTLLAGSAALAARPAMAQATPDAAARAPTRAELLARPRHPYTRRLLAATPTGAGVLADLHAIPRHLPDLRRTDLPPCRYAARCERRRPACDGTLIWAALSPGHVVACGNPA